MSPIQWPALISVVTFLSLSIMWIPAAILKQCSASAFTQTPPATLQYDLPHHLLYCTLYGVWSPWAANSTASRAVECSPCLQFACCWAQHLTLHLSNGDYTLPPAQPLSLFLSESLLPPPSLSFLLLCGEQGRGGEDCAGLHVWRQREVVMFALQLHLSALGEVHPIPTLLSADTACLDVNCDIKRRQQRRRQILHHIIELIK